ncbi:MAG: hypothetical protein GYA58_03395 [Anaerolineaceae bacterium]|nr:hypothetical protein [Anaerolineaceae bacterium]
MTYNVVIEGQTIPVPEEIGANDETVKRAMTPFFPQVSNAMLTRVEKDGVTTITIVKRAGTKGIALTELIRCQGRKNPIIQLYEELQAMDERDQVDLVQVLEMDERIDRALAEGEEQAEAIESMSRRLARSAAQPAPAVILGF